MTTIVPEYHPLLKPFVLRILQNEDVLFTTISKEINTMIQLQSRSMHSQKDFLKLLDKFFSDANELINTEYREHNTKFRMSGVIILDSLIDINDENSSNRRIDISNSLRKLFNQKFTVELYDILFKYTAIAIGHLARVCVSTTDIEFLQSHYIDLTKKLLTSSSEVERFCGPLLLKELITNIPALIFTKRKEIFQALWENLMHKNQLIRNNTAESMEFLFKFVSPREDISEYCKTALGYMKECLPAHAPHEKLIGLLLFFHIIGESDSLSRDRLEKSTVQSGLSINEILWKFLQKKDSRDTELKRKVMGVMPALASIYNEAFNNKLVPALNKKEQKTFLQYFVTHLIETIRQRKERQLAYTTLGKLFLSSQTLATSQTLVTQAMDAVKEGFKEPFCREALSCFTHMVTVSQSNCRRHVTPELVETMFGGGLTEELVMTCNAIMRNFPIIRGFVQMQIMNHITSVLQKHKKLAQQMTGTSAVTINTNNTGSYPGSKDVSLKQGNNNGSGTSGNNSNNNNNNKLKNGNTAGTSGGKNDVMNSNTVSNVSSLTAATPKKPYNSSLWSFFTSNIQIETEPVLSADEQLTFALKVLATHDFFAKSSLPMTRDIHSSQTRDTLSPVVSTHGANSNVLNALSESRATGLLNAKQNTNSTHNMHNSSFQTMMSTVQMKKIEQYTDFNPLGTLISIVSDSVVVYLDDPNPDIRQAAAISCLAVLDTIIVKIESFSYDYLSVAKILDRLLHLGIGDDSSTIRCNVFASIQPSLDHMIAKSENFYCLIEGLNDENPRVRAATMSVLARVAHYDPLHIMPLIRLTMERLIKQIQHSKDSQLCVESIHLLQKIVRGANSLIVPHVNQLIEPLMVLISVESYSPMLLGASLSTIGDLAVAAPEVAQQNLQQLFPKLTYALNDYTNKENREIAVQAMGKVMSSIALLLNEPYTKFPDLYEGLVRAIQSENDDNSVLQLEAMRTAGLLGAVDPSIYEKHKNILDKEVKVKLDSKTIKPDLFDDYVNQSSNLIIFDNIINVPLGTDQQTGQESQNEKRLTKIEKYYVSVVITELKDTLLDLSLSPQHQTVLELALKLIKHVGHQSFPFIHEYIDSLILRLNQKDTNNTMKGYLLQHMASLILVIGRPMYIYTNTLIQVINTFFDTSHLEKCLEIIESTYSTFSVADFNTILHEIGPSMVRIIQQEISGSSNSSGNSSNDYTSGHNSIRDFSSLNFYENNQTSSNTVTSTVNSGLITVHKKFSNLSLAGAISSALSGSDTPTREKRSESGFGLGLPSYRNTHSNTINYSYPNTSTKTKAILNCMVNIKDKLSDHKRQLLNVVVQVFEDSNMATETRKFAIGVYLSLADDSNLSEFASRLIHPILRIMSMNSNNEILLGTALTALSTLLCKLGMSYLPFVLPVQRVLVTTMGNLGLTHKPNVMHQVGLWDNSQDPSSMTSKNNNENRVIYQQEEYEALVIRLLKQKALPLHPSSYKDIEIKKTRKMIKATAVETTTPINILALENVSDNSKLDSPSDLSDWLQRLCAELIRQAPNPIIRMCTPLVKANRASGEQLFNAAFNCVWESLYYGESTDVMDDIPLITAIEFALASDHVPRDVVVSLLNLAEFMDMQDKRLPIDVQLLAQQAEQQNMYARCLRYREIELNSANQTPSSECLEVLITISNELGLEEKSQGVLIGTTELDNDIKIRPLWIEKLRDWEKAYESYYREINAFRDAYPEGTLIVYHKEWVEARLGVMRCLQGMGEYDKVLDFAFDLKQQIIKANDNRETYAVTATVTGMPLENNTHDININGGPLVLTEDEDDAELQRLSLSWSHDVNILGANAAWSLGRWEDMGEFINPLHDNDRNDVELHNKSSFYEAVYCIKLEKFNEAKELIEMTRKRLAYAVSTLLSENYNRAYRGIVSLQILSELEEIIDFKRNVAINTHQREINEIEKNLDDNLTTFNNNNNSQHGKGLGFKRSAFKNSNDVTMPSSFGKGHNIWTGVGTPITPTSQQQHSLSHSYHGSNSNRFNIQIAKDNLLSKWRARLKWIPKEIDVYKQILAVHTLVVDPLDDLDSWLEFATLCRKEKKQHLCKNVLKRLGSRVIETLDRNELAGAGSHSSRPSSLRNRTALSVSGIGGTVHNGIPKGIDGLERLTSPTVTNTTSASSNYHADIHNSAFANSDTAVPYVINPSTLRTTIQINNNDRNYQQSKQFSSSSQVLFASCKYLWDIGHKQEALHELSSFIENMDSNVSVTFLKENNNNYNNTGVTPSPVNAEKDNLVIQTRKNSVLAPASFGMTSATMSSLLEDVESGRISNGNLAALGFNPRSTRDREKSNKLIASTSTNSQSVFGRERSNSNSVTSRERRSSSVGGGSSSGGGWGNNNNNNVSSLYDPQNPQSLYDSFPIDQKAFRVQCLLKRAEWLREVGDVPFSDVLRTVQEARELAPDQYSVWHEWAVANYNQLQIVDKIDRSSTDFGPASVVYTTREARVERERGSSMSAIDSSSSSSTINPINNVKFTTAAVAAATATKSNPLDKSPLHDKSSLNNDRSPLSSARQLHPSNNPPPPLPPTVPPPPPARRDSESFHSAGGAATQRESPRSNIATNNIKDVNILKKLKFSETYNKPTTVHGMTLANLVSVDQGLGKDTESEAMKYAHEAINGFVKSIIYGTGQPVANLLQDTLRLLTLWFSYGTKDSIYLLLKTELDKISPEYWLRVIPQLIARMHVKSVKISELLRKLLIRLADSHPQALVCPISVALNTTYAQQKKMAQDVLKELRRNKGVQMVDEAAMLSRELMRVAMTPHEIWYDGLEKAAQQYIEQKNVELMKATLFELHEAMELNVGGTSDPSMSDKIPMQSTKKVSSMTDTSTGSQDQGFSENTGNVGISTLRDVSFRQSYGRQLNDALSWLLLFHETNDYADLHQAWEIYQQIFKKIKVQIGCLKKIELRHVSPELSNASSLSLAVPGTYIPGQETVFIRSFSSSVDVIASKQRPRKISMTGSNGVVYPFLLKGHEDLRQDERVMQLFGLINVCLENDRNTSNRGLHIVTYSVLPLSNNSGVIGWVENCDTMNQLIKQYRELKGLRLNIETKLLASKYPLYDQLPLMGKVEVFTQVLQETTGQDLAKMIWLKSKTADSWVERRHNYTKSMAVMSMVGYILGLGDRHPSNLMVDRVTGSVVHIDFGDCFEVTAKRSKYPEIVPFRLTRMLMEAMERTGFAGTYNHTCNRVMGVLRDKSQSLMAMLEAFVYDPLISWRLLATSAKDHELSRGVEVEAATEGSEGMMPLGWDTSDGGGTLTKASNLVDKMISNPAETFTVKNSFMGGSFIGANKIVSPPRKIKRKDSNNSSTNDNSNIAAAGTKSTINNAHEDDDENNNLNERAIEVITRIQAKLTGRDFLRSGEEEDLDVEDQVSLLIQEATRVENLCQLYSGWCPLW